MYMQYTENQYPFNNICIMQYTENQYNICNNACICSTLQYNANSMYVYAVHYKVQRQQYVCIWNTCTDCTKQWLYRPIYTVSYCTAKRIRLLLCPEPIRRVKSWIDEWIECTPSHAHTYIRLPSVILKGTEWNSDTETMAHCTDCMQVFKQK